MSDEDFKYLREELKNVAYPEQIDFYIVHGADVNADDKFGKTADVKTGEVTAEHYKTAKVQVDIAKAMMKAKRSSQIK